ncbi:MAG: tRNA(Met) cytidine acetyltransferase [Cocleimonas sp.]|jgi:tRNA(Met) cytidine acetyltransferase
MQFNPNDRHILVITGEHDKSLEYAKKITSELDLVEVLDQKKASGFLGQELDAVIFSMHEQFDANAFGAITGTIRGGGYLVLLHPIKLSVSSLFITRFNQILENTPQVHFLERNLEEELQLPNPPRNNFAQVFATPDQENAVAAIIKVVTGHRRRPLVITSDRGRGKSAALGIAAAELAKRGIKNIIICAPSKKTAAMVFKHAELGFVVSNFHISNKDEYESNLRFFSPDELQLKKPEADLVLIDEAAAIPMPLLISFLKQYSRIVFASTQHGYEGCGRGFAINFLKVLDNKAPEWKNCELKVPIRWNENDTLEQFTFDALLLNAEAVDKSVIINISLNDCHFSQINKQKLLSPINNRNSRLKQLFGLLISAHYQTKPSDLMQLLDDDSVSIYCLEANDAIVAVAIIMAEGNIDPELSTDIFASKRRLQGHLVAQALSSNIGIESAIELSGERISRIAVHPNLQYQGLGTYLLQKLIEKSSADYLSTSYGATEPLLNFWQNSGFLPVHLGIKRDASSGAHSVTMLYPKNANGQKLTIQAQFNFSRSFPQLLSDTLNELESEIAFILLSSRTTKAIDVEDSKILHAFAYESRGYENTHYLIWELVLSKLANNQNLNDQERKILILKVLQKQSWDSLKHRMGSNISGKKDALVLIRKAVAKLL